MIFEKINLKGPFKVKLDKKYDDRGFFSRLWCSEEYQALGLNNKLKQINNSYNSKKGTLRGLHFQYPPKSETKIIRCISGSIWDVIVDIRLNSETYGKFFGTELSSKNRKMLYVPEGFAHGFISLEDRSEIIYLSTQSYDQNSEGTLRWDDSFHGIKWPIKPSCISEKDKNICDWSDSKSINL